MASLRRSLAFTLAVAALVTLSPRTANAEIITWLFTGNVNVSNGAFASTIPIGTPAAFTMTFDIDTPENAFPCGSVAGSGFYPAVQSGSISVGSLSRPTAAGGEFQIQAPNGSCAPNFNMGGPLVEFHVPFALDDQITPNTRLFEILAHVRGADTHAQDLRDILAPVYDGFVFVQNNGGPQAFLAFNAQIQVVTPEPGTVTLLGLGLAMIARRGRKFIS